MGASRIVIAAYFKELENSLERLNVNRFRTKGKTIPLQKDAAQVLLLS